jgi:REP element-mobilizing transposase RayT
MGRQIRKLSSEFPIQITARTNNREFFPIPMAEAWEVFCDYLFLTSKFFGLRVLQFVLMSNHFHMICYDPTLELSKAMQFLMRETSLEISRLSGRINRLWGRPFHSSVISTPIYFLHAYKYNYRNPVAAGICHHPAEYPWSTLQILLGKRHGIIPIEEDKTLFDDIGGTLQWIDEAYDANQVEALQQGFRRKIFELGKDPNTNKIHPMSQPDSLGLMRRVPEW